MRDRVLLALAALAFACTAQARDIFEANRSLGSGVNLGNALEAPAEGDWGVTLKPEYFRLIKEAGFDTVRLPVRWSAHAGETAPYTIDPSFFERVDWAIRQAAANELNIIIDAHHYEALDKDPANHIARLAAIWEQIASRYKGQPASVIFELYNEPHGGFDAATWNKAVPVLLEAVRKTNPSRPVIVGPAGYNAVRWLEKLLLPEGDRNLIVTVHYYDPFDFTHQGAGWIKGAEAWLGRTWGSAPEEERAVRDTLETAADWGSQHDRPIFLGEYGTFEKADEASRAHWTRFVSAEASRLGMSRAYWEFCSGFGLYEAAQKRWNEPLKSAALGSSWQKAPPSGRQ